MVVNTAGSMSDLPPVRNGDVQGAAPLDLDPAELAPADPSSSGVFHPVEAANKAPQGGFLNLIAKIFIGKDADTVKEALQLYKPQSGAALTAWEGVKVVGRTAGLVLGSLFVGLSRAVALTVGTVAFGLGSVIGLPYICFADKGFDNILALSGLVGKWVASTPAFLGTACQQYALQQEDHKISRDDLFESLQGSNEEVAMLGSFIIEGAIYVASFILSLAS